MVLKISLLSNFNELISILTRDAYPINRAIKHKTRLKNVMYGSKQFLKKEKLRRYDIYGFLTSEDVRKSYT